MRMALIELNEGGTTYGTVHVNMDIPFFCWAGYIVHETTLLFTFESIQKSINYHFVIRTNLKPVHDHCVEPTLPKNRSESCSSIFHAALLFTVLNFPTT